MRKWLYILIACVVFILACALFPAFSEFITVYASVPAMSLLSRLSGRVGFPVVGGFLILTVIAACTIRPRVAGTAILLLAAFSVLWFPPQLTRAEEVLPAESSAVFELCSQLVSELNAQGRQVMDLQEALTTAQEVMRAPAAAKAARYPEWMRALKLAGIYIPFTGEALVDATRHPVALPFTAAHELAHMLGIADEGQANLIAYQRSVGYGGAFAYSARLWALKYALTRVENPGEIVRALDAEILTDLSCIPSVTGVDGDYGDIVDLLIARMPEPRPVIQRSYVLDA